MRANLSKKTLGFALYLALQTSSSQGVASDSNVVEINKELGCNEPFLTTLREIFTLNIMDDEKRIGHCYPTMNDALLSDAPYFDEAQSDAVFRGNREQSNTIDEDDQVPKANLLQKTRLSGQTDFVSPAIEVLEGYFNETIKKP